jgi:2,3-bisphosphoglycerate-independent phosphoglycerate mutase
VQALALIVPGLSDGTLRALKDRTPLEAAELPAFDRLASRGRMGTAQVIPGGVPSGSVVGLPALLGYDVRKLTLRRGPLEAHGLGVPIEPGDLVFRLNFVSTFRGTMADTRAGHVSHREAMVLLEALKRIPSSLHPRLHVGLGYRHLWVVPGGADLEVSTVPPHQVVGQPLKDFRPYGRDAGRFVEYLEDARQVLADHDVNRVRIDLGENPADAVWLWGEGSDTAVAPLAEHLKASVAIVAGAPLVRGLAHKVGASCPEVAGATGDLDTDLVAKRNAALEATGNHDLVMIHVAAVNEASRAGDARGKVAALERIDRELVAPLLDWVEADPGRRRILVTSDHQTSVESARSAEEPVPFAVYGAGLEGVRQRPFTEHSARASDLELGDAASLLDFFLAAGARAAGN